MKKKTVLLLSFILCFSATAFAQTKTVTNADLEKFRQKRLQNEKNYRENYERLGFPSPEELERKRVADERNLIEFSRQLEAQRLEREALQAETENQARWLQNQYLQSQSGGYTNYNSGAYVYGGYLPFSYGYNNYGRFNRRPRVYGNRNQVDDPYPWMISPQFRRQRALSSQPSRFLPRPKPTRPSTRPGRGRN